MQAITYTDARNNLASILDKAVNDHEPQIITRRNGDNAVLISLDDYNAWMETDHLLKSPRNAKRLLESLENVRAGGDIQERELIEE